MSKKKWTVIVLVILSGAGYFKFFYKTWNNEGVTKNADCIIVFDKKKITNTLIWQFITTPSQWSKADLFSSSDDDKVSWDDMIKLPDYVFIFHKQGQPDNAFYTLAEINDKEDFEKGLKQYHFDINITGSFISRETGIEILQKGNKLLIANAAVEDKKYIQQVADELFLKKLFADNDLLKQYVQSSSHAVAALPFFKNGFFSNGLSITGDFDKNGIYFSAAMQPAGIQLTPTDFNYCDTSLCYLGFTQPLPGIRSIFADSSLEKISRILNFSIDSLLQPANRSYQLDITGIHQRTDSAISYTYDDDFNPVEKVVVNKVEEPAFNFTVKGDSVSNIYSYWNNNGKLERSGDSNIFTPVPFVRSYCSVKNENTLMVTSVNYQSPAMNSSEHCVLFMKLLLAKLPPTLLKYFSPGVMQLLNNIESASAAVTNKNGQVILDVHFNKKKNDLPVITF